MKKFAPIVCVAICVFALFLAGCSCTVNVVTDKNTSANQAATPQKQTSGAQYAVPNGEVLVEGSTITVALEGNPTTGYEWTAEINGDNLKAVSDDYKSSGKSNIAAGAGGVYTFKFEGVGDGTGTLSFKYARSWEQTPQDQWIKIDVVTKNGKISDTVAESSDGIKSESHA